MISDPDRTESDEEIEISQKDKGYEPEVENSNNEEVDNSNSEDIIIRKVIIVNYSFSDR